VSDLDFCCDVFWNDSWEKKCVSDFFDYVYVACSLCW
jgi:hypothetical protein